MQYTFKYFEDDDYILINLSGQIDIPGIKNALRDAGPVILEHQCNKLLGDFRTTTLRLGVMEIIDLYLFWLETLKSNKLSPYSARRALLLTSTQWNAENFRFFETFSRNRNSSVKIFFNMEEAVEWLKNGETKAAPQ